MRRGAGMALEDAEARYAAVPSLESRLPKVHTLIANGGSQEELSSLLKQSLAEVLSRRIAVVVVHLVRGVEVWVLNHRRFTPLAPPPELTFACNTHAHTFMRTGCGAIPNIKRRGTCRIPRGTLVQSLFFRIRNQRTRRCSLVEQATRHVLPEAPSISHS